MGLILPPHLFVHPLSVSASFLMSALSITCRLSPRLRTSTPSQQTVATTISAVTVSSMHPVLVTFALSKLRSVAERYNHFVLLFFHPPVIEYFIHIVSYVAIHAVPPAIEHFVHFVSYFAIPQPSSTLSTLYPTLPSLFRQPSSTSSTLYPILPSILSRQPSSTYSFVV
jgi:hypothetical protein